MSYRRPHNRRAHLRRNKDGSTSLVRGTRVNGHNYTASKNKKVNNTYSTSSDSDYIWYLLDKLFWFFAALLFICSILAD